MSENEAHLFPPPFEAFRKNGEPVRIDDVDALLALAAEHAGVPLRRLDRRKLEAALRTIAAPPLHRERAAMVLVGRARQRRTQALRAGIRRTRATVVVVLVMLAMLVYGFRLERTLQKKLRVARARAGELIAAREAARAIDQRLAAPGLDMAARDELSLELERAEDRVAVVKGRYDDAANDYDFAVRGFVTEAFVRLVSLPRRLPMSWERDAPLRATRP